MQIINYIFSFFVHLTEASGMNQISLELKFTNNAGSRDLAPYVTITIHSQ